VEQQSFSTPPAHLMMVNLAEKYGVIYNKAKKKGEH
jgi:hypothetical protein